MDKNWWKDAEESVQIDERTRRALDSVIDKKNKEVRTRIENEKRRRKELIEKPILIEKMMSTSYWADVIGFTPEAISGWCKEGVIQAEQIRGHWRISEASMIAFLEKERSRRVS